MLGRVASSRVVKRRWSAVILFVTCLLIQEVASDLASSLSLRKCSCNKYEAWNGAACVESNSTVVPVYNKTSIDSVKGEVDSMMFAVGILSSMVQNVTISPLEAEECPEGHFPSLLSDDIMLLPDGRLLWRKTMRVFTNDVFCSEFFWDIGGAFFEVYVCLPLPTVPRCCPANHLLHPDGSCHPHKGQALQAPPLQVGNHFAYWDGMDSVLVSLTCDEHEFQRQIKLGTGNDDGRVIDTQPVASLEWSPMNIWVASAPWQNHFCVGLQQTETEELQYMAQLCFRDHKRYYKHHCNSTTACVRKCCPEGQVLVDTYCQQVYDSNLLWHPEQIPGQKVNEQWKLMAGEPGCEAHLHVGDMHILPNGSLHFSTNNVSVPPSMYCADNRIGLSGEPMRFALLCFPPKEYTCYWRDILIKVGNRTNLFFSSQSLLCVTLIFICTLFFLSRLL